MKIFAISDLHLPGGDEKPMNKFGAHWDDYMQKIALNWKSKVTDEDYVLLAGDLSWAMRLEDVVDDVQVLENLPGKKIIIKGNHDYWWQSIGKVRNMLPSSVFALQNDCLKVGNIIFSGTRGWTCPNTQNFTEQDKKIYLRESERLELSLKEAKKHQNEGDIIIALFHYPPYNVKRESSNFTNLFEKYGVSKVVYGHLHGKDSLAIRTSVKNDVEYILSSCDLVNFELQEVL